MTGLSQRKNETATNELRFVYDGWNLIATLNPQPSTLNTFAWDFGLSTLSVQPSTPFQPSNSFVSFDGNGNVVALFNAANSSETARYEYGPFGELLRATGPMAKANPFRFSTKYQDDEMDLLYYGYRYYNASTGRWLSYDPVEEPGFELLQEYSASATANGDLAEYELEDLDSDGNPLTALEACANAFTFADNDGLNGHDFLGLADKGKPGKAKPPKKKKPYKVKNVTITFYCNCKKCCGREPDDAGYGICADGTKACKGTLAADWSKFPKGSKIEFKMPDGTTVSGTVHDKGGAVKGNHLDVWCASHAEAGKKGTFTTTITVTPP